MLFRSGKRIVQLRPSIRPILLLSQLKAISTSSSDSTSTRIIHHKTQGRDTKPMDGILMRTSQPVLSFMTTTNFISLQESLLAIDR